MVRWMCGVKLHVQDRVPSKGLRERLGLDDIISVLWWVGCNGVGMCYGGKIVVG